MPANLNALIRYKTINTCLSNPYRKWTISDLVTTCSTALSANRGIQTGISERSIRDDIRVMRSDILGFNAPIIQQDGFYFYDDPSYSIFDVKVSETELLKRVLDFILEIQSEIHHPEMGEIIQSICEALPATEEETESYDETAALRDDSLTHFNIEAPDPLTPPESGYFEEKCEQYQEKSRKEKSSGILSLAWSKILKLI